MSRCLNANGLTINLKKTHYMVFHRARIKAKDLNVEMQSNNIDFQSLNILYFRKLVIQRVSLLMFKISKCDVPKPLYALFRINNSYHNYQTRRSESIDVLIGRTEAIYKTFSYFGAHIWNHISNNISTNVSYSSFKHLVKFYIQNNSHVII